MTTVIAVLNESTVLTDDQVAAALPDLQTQVVRDFQPAWGQSAHLTLVRKPATPSASAWQIVVLDDSDQADALGYHDVTGSGLPLAKVFVKTTEADRGSWTVVFSHELLEMLANPMTDSVVYVDDGSGSAGWLVPVEVCDAVEGDALGYTVGGTLVTDFVLPSWFQAGSQGPWDFQQHLPQALYLAQGGYIGIAPVELPEGWQQVTGDLRKPAPKLSGLTE